MKLTDLINLLHSEVQKSYDFIEEASFSRRTDSGIHIALEKMEVDIPVTFDEKQELFNQRKVKKLPQIAQKLQVPYSAENFVISEKIDKLKNFKGKNLEVNLISNTEKVTSDTLSKFGRIKITLIPIKK